MYELYSEFEVTPDYRAQLSLIIDKPLTVEAIDTYAESALNDIIYLVQSVVEQYKHYPTYSFESETDYEDAALKYFGLSNIEQILDHIAATADQIQQIDATIASAKAINKIIVPPDDIERQQANLGGEIEQKKILPRLKTTLFILANDFGVNINSEDELTNTKGLITENMMRGSSYYLLAAHKLNRTVLVCDEEGNVTYVFNNSKLQEINRQADDLLELSKNQLNELLDSNASLGKRVVYSTRFVQNMIAALDNPADYNSLSESERDGKYLYPKAENGVLSMAGIARALELSPVIIKRAIRELGDRVGETSHYKFGPRTAIGYLPEQKELIHRYLQENGYFDIPPEDYLNEYGVSQKFGINNHIIHRVVEVLGDRMGEIRAFKSKSRATRYYSPEQQDLIWQQLKEDGLFAEDAPTGYLNIFEMAKAMGLGNTVVENAIVSVRSELGELQIYNFNGARVRGLSPAQQDVLRHHFELKGFFAEKAPDGVVTFRKLADQNETTVNIVQRAVDNLAEELGEIREYRFRGVTLPGLNLEQQRQIIEFMDKNGHFSPELPKDYISAKNLISQLGISYPTLAKAQEELADELGSVEVYRINNNIRPAYSPRQQEILRQYISNLRIQNAMKQ